MFKIRWRNLSTRERSIFLTLFAVLLPTLVLFYGQYLALTDLREKSAAVLQNNLRQSAFEIEDKAEARLLEEANEILLGFPESGQQPWNGELIKQNLAVVLEKHPGVESAFVFADHPNQYKLAISSREDGYRESKDNPDGTLIITGDGKQEEDFLLPLISSFQSSLNHRTSGNFLIAQRRCERCQANGQSPRQILYLYHVLSESKDFTNLRFVGVSLNKDYLIDKVLAPAIDETIRSNHDDSDLDLIFGVYNEQQQLLYSSNSDKNLEFEVKVPLNRVFPLFSIAGSFSNNKIADLSNWYFWRGMILMSLVLGLLALGAWLLFGVAQREINLAESKSAFVSNVSHELKTPLALIRMFAETLQSGRVKDPEKTTEYYRIISTESVRLTNLINNILDFSAIEAGRKEYNFIESNVAEVVREVVQNYSYSLENAGFTVECHFDDDLPTIRIDRDAFSQAILNLLNNAAKYSTNEKFISIGIESRQESVAVCITDRGIGIAQQEQEKIFGNFYRVGGSSDVHNVKGSGLGLALVKHIVEAHRGSVSVASTLNHGSTFTILLPIKMVSGKGKVL